MHGGYVEWTDVLRDIEQWQALKMYKRVIPRRAHQNKVENCKMAFKSSVLHCYFCFLSWHQFGPWLQICTFYIVWLLSVNTHTLRHNFSPVFHTNSTMPGKQCSLGKLCQWTTVIMSYFSVMFFLILMFRLLLSDFGFMACCFHGLSQLNLSHPTMCNDKEASVCD